MLAAVVIIGSLTGGNGFAHTATQNQGLNRDNTMSALRQIGSGKWSRSQTAKHTTQKRL
jgi:hypothetical protein